MRPSVLWLLGSCVVVALTAGGGTAAHAAYAHHPPGGTVLLRAGLAAAVLSSCCPFGALGGRFMMNGDAIEEVDDTGDDDVDMRNFIQGLRSKMELAPSGRPMRPPTKAKAKARRTAAAEDEEEEAGDVDEVEGDDEVPHLLGVPLLPLRTEEEGGEELGGVPRNDNGEEMEEEEVEGAEHETEAAGEDDLETVPTEGRRVPAYQWSDEGADVLITIQATSLLFEYTRVTVERGEVRMFGRNAVGQEMQLELELRHDVLSDHAATTWMLDERVGIDIRLRKARPHQRWTQLVTRAPAVLPPTAFQAGGTLARPSTRGGPPLPECRHGRGRSASCVAAHARLDTLYVLYSEKGAAMAPVQWWVDNLPGVQAREGLAELGDVIGEPEIGKIFEADGGPEMVQERLQAFILARPGAVDDPSAWASWTQLGNTWRALGNPFHAVQCFRKALALKGSDDPDVLLNLALVLQNAGFLMDSSLPLIERAVLLAGMLYRYIRANFYFEAAQTLALRQQQLEQNRKDGQPEGGSGGDTPGGMEEAQDFTQRAYTDYHATLQLQPGFSPAADRLAEMEGGPRAWIWLCCGVDTWSWPTAVLTGLAFQALAITLLIFYYADLWPTTWRPFLVQVGFLSADAVAHHRGGGGGGGGGGSGRQRKKHQKRG